MKLSNVCDEDLQKVALLKNRKGCATSDALRAQQILKTRNLTHGGFWGGNGDLRSFPSTHDFNSVREYKTFEEENGFPIPGYKEAKDNG